MSLKLVAQNADEETGDAMIETIALTEAQIEYLERMSHELNPVMPKAFAWPHAVRAILDRFEQSGIDLTAASSEDEIARLAAAKLRAGTPSTERLCASASSRSAVRREYRSNLPATDRCRSGRPPR